MSRQIILTQGAVEAGLWYVLSLRYDEEIVREIKQTPPDMIEYLSRKLKLDPQMKVDLAEVLEEEVQVVKEQRLADRELGAEKKQYLYPTLDEIWPRIVLAKKRSVERPTTTIPAAVYERLRTKAITSRGVYSSQGMVRWPPTCQTITKRCGGSWNKALENMGLMTSKRGRARGSLKFSDETYLQASVEFIKHCREVDRATTVAYYCQWVARERRKGNIWPSAAAQRQLRGTWNRVVELGTEMIKGKMLS
ncbi:MAG: multidrug transporter [Mobiluncus porci]|uniref:multidrug transporter n=1 Tax=Mobiluncus TaxID=2050 RepID=UPI0023F4CF3F|nr:MULTISPECIES: multidrug transporter [Mobiluncus]MCI6584227.1 multidrug transporter [Mobiluncus sp.]MDD7541861.1 multidrug transporter [Mobiluncus porci]MDY5749331.1 multidrug transporter [Mobiluncus porci]